MRIRVAPGSEQYLQYAKNRLEALRALREDLNLPTLQKAYKVSPDTLITLRSTIWEDYIDISGGGSGFVVRSIIRTPDGDSYASTTRGLIPRTLDSIGDFPGHHFVFLSPYPFESGQSYLTASSPTTFGYYTGTEFTGGGGIISNYFAVMKHAGSVYRVNGSGNVYPLDTDTPVLGSVAQSFFWHGFYAINSQAVSFSSQSSIGPYQTQRFALSTSEEGVVGVTYETPEEVESFGNERIVFDHDQEVIEHNGVATRVTRTTHDINFPVCKALDNAGSIKQIVAHSVRDDLQSIFHTEFNTGEAGSTFTFGQENLIDYSTVVTFEFPDGSTHEITKFRHTHSLSSSGSGDPAIGALAGSITASQNVLDTVLPIVLFASASWNTLIYRLLQTESAYVQTGSHLIAAGIQADMAITQTTTLRIMSVVDGVVRELASQTFDHGTTATGITAGIQGMSGSINTHTDTSLPFDGHPYLSEERFPTPQQAQFARLPTGEYLGTIQYVDFDIVEQYNAFASRENLDALKRAVINRVLAENGHSTLAADADITNYKWGFTEIRVV